MRLWFTSILAVQIVLLFCSLSVHANIIREWQAPYADQVKRIAKTPKSVLQELLLNKPDADSSLTLKAQYHSVLSMVYLSLSFPQKSLDNAQRALQYIDAQSQPWLYHNTKLNESQALDTTGQPKAGLLGANAALVWGEISDDVGIVVNALYVRGVLLNSLLDYPGALRDLQRAYRLAPTTDTLSRGDVAGMLALVYEYRREPMLAIPFFREAADYHRRHDHSLELSIALFGLGKANKDIGNTALGRDQLNASLQLAEKVGDQQGVAYALKELASISLELKEYQAAEQQLDQALGVFKLSENNLMLLNSYKTMLQISLAQNKLLVAEEYLVLAMNLVDPDTMPLQHISLLELQSTLLASKGQYQQAFALLLSTVKRKQRLASQTSTQQLHSLRSQYEIDLKERENQLLEQQNKLQQSDLNSVETKNLQLLLLFGATLIICALLILLVYRALKNRTRLEVLANTDGLTGLSNRRHAFEQLHLQVNLAKRHDLPLAIAIIDIDLFKNINDSFGHAVGDQVLERLGALCKATFRQTDVIGRIGGEEFVIALPHTALEDAKRTLMSLSLGFKSLTTSFEVDQLSLSLSCGLTELVGESTLQALLLECDQALYQAKHNGRDQIVVYDGAQPSTLPSDM